jgi:hypothetical protein
VRKLLRSWETNDDGVKVQSDADGFGRGERKWNTRKRTDDPSDEGGWDDTWQTFSS